jgi:hypothetical protein
LLTTSKLIQYRPPAILNSFVETVAMLPAGFKLNFHVVRPGTLKALREHLRMIKNAYDVVYFDVHGSLDDEGR